MSKDATENQLEEYPDVFVDIFNNLILEGHGVLKEDSLTPMTLRAYTRKTDGRIRSGMRDVCKRMNSNEVFHLICGIENQTEIDNTMPERVMGYEYAGYEEQIKQIMDQNKIRKKTAGSRRIFWKQKLTPVVTGVLYYGEKKWNHPKRLHDMLQFPDADKEILKRYVADYPMNLVQVAHLTKEERERLTSDFRIVAEYLACRNDKEKWNQFLKNTKEIRHIEELLDVIWELSGDEHYLILKEKVKGRKTRKEKWTMCEMTKELIRIGREDGIQTGVQTGIQTGVIAMIRDNLDMGNEKESILEKLVKYFSITMESAVNYYNQVVTE